MVTTTWNAICKFFGIGPQGIPASQLEVGDVVSFRDGNVKMTVLSTKTAGDVVNVRYVESSEMHFYEVDRLLSVSKG